MMRFIQYTAITLCLCLGLASCSSDDETTPTPACLQVNYINLAGHWQLMAYNGHSLAEGTYLYITFDRREHTFQMYDNLQSMYGQKRTGTYLLEADEKTETTTLSGFYDNGVGPWASEYTVSSLTESRLTLTARDATHEVQTYQRITAIPDQVKK